jgi:hypothetical protein
MTKTKSEKRLQHDAYNSRRREQRLIESQMKDTFTQRVVSASDCKPVRTRAPRSIFEMEPT